MEESGEKQDVKRIGGTSCSAEVIIFTGAVCLGGGKQLCIELLPQEDRK